MHTSFLYIFSKNDKAHTVKQLQQSSIIANRNASLYFKRLVYIKNMTQKKISLLKYLFQQNSFVFRQLKPINDNKINFH